MFKQEPTFALAEYVNEMDYAMANVVRYYDKPDSDEKFQALFEARRQHKALGLMVHAEILRMADDAGMLDNVSTVNFETPTYPTNP